MIHYSCDLCKREIRTADEMHYVVKIEVHPALDDDDESEQDDCDHLGELHDLLEKLNDPADDDLEPLQTRQLRFDLCPECREKFLKNPLGRESSHEFDFSQN